jgi:hypothetical protein
MELRGLLDPTVARGLHAIIMRGLGGACSEGGRYCLNRRVTTYRGCAHAYPHIATHQEWERVLTGVTDKHNALIADFKEKRADGSLHDAWLELCKIAAHILYQVVTWHPFSDGNGRTARLLANHALGVLVPFDVPIYDAVCPVSNDRFIEALIHARETGTPARLTVLIVESLWHSFGVYCCDVK